MALYLRKVIEPQAHENYRVILKLDDDEVEIGSMMRKFKAAWERFAGDEANLAEFLNMKRRRFRRDEDDNLKSN